jgi:hypothetical protein
MGSCTADVCRNVGKLEGTVAGWRPGIEDKGYVRPVYMPHIVGGKEDQVHVVIAVAMFAIYLFVVKFPHFYPLLLLIENSVGACTYHIC